MWEVLQSETWCVTSGDHRLMKESITRKKRPVTRRNDDDGEDKQNRQPNFTKYVELGLIECLKLTNATEDNL